MRERQGVEGTGSRSSFALPRPPFVVDRPVSHAPRDLGPLLLYRALRSPVFSLFLALVSAFSAFFLCCGTCGVLPLLSHCATSPPPFSPLARATSLQAQRVRYEEEKMKQSTGYDVDGPVLKTGVLKVRVTSRAWLATALRPAPTP